MWWRGVGFHRLVYVVVGVVVVLGTVAQAVSVASALPDGRQWEMVSPLNKNGARIAALGAQEDGGVSQAAVGGGAFTWVADTAIGSEPAGNLSFEWSQVFSVRGPGGWSSRDIAPPHEAAPGAHIGDGTEYKFFSPDLSLGLVAEMGATPLSSQATEKTIYLREDAGSSYLPLVTRSNVFSERAFDGPTKGSALELDAQEKAGETPTFRGAAPDLNHVVFSDNLKEGLTSNANKGLNLYEWAGGQLQLVSVLPGGTTTAISPQLAGVSVRHAVSDDGSRIVWLGGNEGERALYMRDMVKGETVRVDAAQGVPEPVGAQAQFQMASGDGHRVFFIDGQRLTEDAAASSNDLYVFETTNGGDEALKGTLTDLTVDPNAGESAGVQGLLPGASEDGSYVYLVASGVLSENENATVEHEKAAPGADNLYVLHNTAMGWTTTFIARLSSEDKADWDEGGQGGNGSLDGLTSRVSPDGRYFAFMSDGEPTGYDNHDKNSGVADEEVFLYDASAERLVCASCDPSGERPVGALDEAFFPNGLKTQLLIDEAKVWTGRWLAANVPGWTPAELESAFYQSRYLSDNGRLFFNSSDVLVPQDVNGTEDVYEFEPSGVGSCTGGSSAFSGVTGGCVSLISSGSSAEESVFLDASEGGGEVFFLTAAKLAPQDIDADQDVYDARECTTQSPCVATPVAPPECTTADACRASYAPQPPIFGAPASATFSGPGNLTPSAPGPAVVKPKVKALTRAQKLARALKACGKVKAQKKRAGCEIRARKKYGALKAKKTSEGGR